MDEICVTDSGIRLDIESLSVRRATRRIVVHHTASRPSISAREIHLIHRRNGWAGIGYHYLIAPDGTIETGRPDWATGAHAEGANYDTIGVALAGDFGKDEPSPAATESLAMLLAFLSSLYDVELTRENIVGHREVSATACPGENLFRRMDEIVGKAVWYKDH